jgi:hypothetical protein
MYHMIKLYCATHSTIFDVGRFLLYFRLKGLCGYPFFPFLLKMQCLKCNRFQLVQVATNFVAEAEFEVQDPNPH